ncbi:single-strand DNA-binding protein [Spiroplasma syrphidicola EA-1]|uniref:Single-stranded DNA-binding protein n=1 Tax=Spiroplasma syrphidicola EA-1 TaxID=1276229 RepID=R4UJY5_9MOLU|nr:single-stranded DNA-binding protein [Spiroplasma syrphidicola]AGM25621.1 single-strand DNA-binding protein [Spiroplasma syrphidicola EA-1]
MLNRVALVGRLTRDLELKRSVNDKPFVAFTLAVNNNFNDQTAFISCFAWSKVAENMAKYLRKGSLISVDGRLQTRTDNVNGQQTTIMQVVADNVSFLDSRNANVGNVSTDVISTPSNVNFENITYAQPTQNQPAPMEDNGPISFDGDDAILWD